MAFQYASIRNSFARVMTRPVSTVRFGALVAVIAALLAAMITAPAGPVFAQSPPAAPTPVTPPLAPASTPAAAPTALPAAPTAALPPEVMGPVDRLAKSIETAEKSIQQLKEFESELQRLRGSVEEIIYDSTATAETLRPQLAEVKSQIEKLGPAPAAGQSAESATIASERTRLNAMAGALDGAIKTTELAWVRAKQLIDRITVMRYQIFTRSLFERRNSPVLPSTWKEVGERMPMIISRIQYYGSDWMYWARAKAVGLAGIVTGALAAGFLLWFVGRNIVARRRKTIVGIPTFFDRIAASVWEAPARMIAPAAAIGLLYSGLDTLELLFSPWEHAADAALKGLLIFVAGAMLASVALAPALPQWRLIPVDDNTARRLLLCVKGLLGIYIIDTVLVEFGRAIYVPLIVTVAQSFITNVLTALLLAGLLVTRIIPQTGPLRAVNGLDHLDGEPGRLTPLWIKLPVWLITVAIIAASVTGYVALGRFISQQVVLTGTVLAITGLIYLAIRASTRERDGQRSKLGSVMESRFGIDATRQRQLARLTEVSLTFALLLAALPALLLQWGFAWTDIGGWAKAAVFGFEVGHLRISLARILLGVLLFTGLLFATRVAQRWLRDGVLSGGRMDPGIANSVDQAVGYSGVALAALLAVSYAGFDITSLAIVAGALSVGIGFGLQSIVNNFVSGLILLVERPVKVGDWIALGDQQGNVRRISVRSTEIETFDKASLIVPNSELISGRVLNWTHRNLLGRVAIRFSLDNSANPEDVLDIMLACARAHPLVMKTPEPTASLDAFSPTSLDFSLRTTVNDINRGQTVLTELRIAILKELRRSGQIPVAATPPVATPSPAPVA